MTTDSLANVRANLSSYVDEVTRTHERVEIIRDGILAAVLISADDLAGLEETIAILSDPEACRAVSEGLDDVSRGSAASWVGLDRPQ